MNIWLLLEVIFLLFCILASGVSWKGKGIRNIVNKIIGNRKSPRVKQLPVKSRVLVEFREFKSNPPQYCKLIVNASSPRDWMITLIGPKNTIYDGERYALRLKFPDGYPSVAPVAYFVKPYLPKHPHVYPNGDICLSCLGSDWRANMSAESVILSILSMLSSARHKICPSSEAGHDSDPGGRNRDWNYHDDKC